MQSIDDIDYSVLAEEGGNDLENQEQDVNEQQDDFQYNVEEPTVENLPADEEPGSEPQQYPSCESWVFPPEKEGRCWDYQH